MVLTLMITVLVLYTLTRVTALLWIWTMRTAFYSGRRSDLAPDTMS